MFLPWKPNRRAIETFLARQSLREFSYPETGHSRTSPPAGYTVDHNRVMLGTGKVVFHTSVAALERWQMFPGGWAVAHTDGAPVHVGQNVAVVAKAFGVWSTWCCRIVYRLDEDGPVRRVGFAYGTVEGHFAQGEERFSIEWHRDDDSVWYDLLAFSKPRALWARMLYPLVRRMQRRFARESLAAMQRAAPTCAINA